MIPTPPLQVVPALTLPRASLLQLQVLPDQRMYVGSVDDLLADADRRRGCEPMAIVQRGQPIGFYCIETHARCIVGHDFDQPALGLRGFFIAAAWQRQRLGDPAVCALLEDLAVRHPLARLLALAVDQRNVPALKLYLRHGFRDSGERYDGGRAGPQQLLLKPLP